MDVRRTERINLRLDPATNALLREAAAAAGTSLTAYLLDAARERALRARHDGARPAAEAGLSAANGHATPPAAAPAPPVGRTAGSPPAVAFGSLDGASRPAEHRTHVDV